MGCKLDKRANQPSLFPSFVRLKRLYLFIRCSNFAGSFAGRVGIICQRWLKCLFCFFIRFFANFWNARLGIIVCDGLTSKRVNKIIRYRRYKLTWDLIIRRLLRSNSGTLMAQVRERYGGRVGTYFSRAFLRFSMASASFARFSNHDLPRFSTGTHGGKDW